MQIDIQRNKGESLSKQIYQSIVDRIRSGLLEEGSKLPSVRSLSKQLEVSLVTAVKAYKQLEQDGFATSIQGKGTFVKAKISEKKKVEAIPSYDWQLSLQDYLPRSQFARYHIAPQKVHLSSSMIDPKLLPNRYFEHEVQQVLSENPELLSIYGNVQGDNQLRSEMSAYLKRSGVTSTPENILVTSGLQQSIDLVARTFVGPGDVVVMEAPTYPGAIDIFRGRGATILTVPVDKDGMRIDILQNVCEKHKPKVIFTIPTFHNPTGVVMSLKRRKQLLDIAGSIHSIIVEDDPCSEIYFEKKPPVTLKSMDQFGNVIYLRGLSKTIAPSCRIGILTASGSIFNRLLAAKANADLGSPLLTQKAILPLINSKRMIDHSKKLRTALKIRRDLALDLLTSLSPEGVSWTIPEGGLNLWISLPSWIDSHLLLSEAKKQQITFLPGSACYPVGQENNHLRISYSYINEELLKHGITTLCNIFHAAISSQKTSENRPNF
ncbi:PLP-dependent aminotransferase family protein [Bacillus inaquosorum]|uniref:MocR-like pyridoxine biosynthesis transcription factor PdxR n=1 Tax=Bacillus inaquosorum TaxID=483913 RepID=UPI00227FAFE7|nr:PLP-dependent aminotransferase family protein [Bacillus inaquosorum]MCY7785743.1 PLP-dependent aminotransferase family protein [Bacillus inaquosorum]MCY7819994.1 PLP-dependent aminotransferase family protein [Bacillus inaquosorum]MCY7938605.1 PLP-dependent aminotransferase family protein [Bacillus inaquosorum]MCY8139830.1 PLP-dependent aminotransferase family protein [Bacillus inaquosorum]MCY8420452.1 PLP-dependent aminotransferase family protein [Bacillus inaquosorum]